MSSYEQIRSSIPHLEHERDAAARALERRDWRHSDAARWAERARNLATTCLGMLEPPRPVPDGQWHDVCEYDGDAPGPWMGFVVEGHVPPLQLLLSMVEYSNVNLESLTDTLLARGYDPLLSLPLILEHIQHAHLKEVPADGWEPEDEDDTPDMVWDYVDAPEEGTRPVTVFELQTIELHTAQHPVFPPTALPIEQLLGLRRIPAGAKPEGFNRTAALREWAIRGRGASGALHKLVEATSVLVHDVEHTRRWAAEVVARGDADAMRRCLEAIANPDGYARPEWWQGL